MKTLAVFAHYDYDNEVKEYVIYYLTQLKLICDEIIFVSTSELKEKECSQISSICSEIITRGNKGHDFYSYKVGLDYIGDLSPYEQVILCNDSCIGPLFDLEAYFNNMNELDVDFWGVSACARPFLHIQSYFLVFNRTVINSIVFKDFWQQVNVLNNKDEIVMNYEVGLSQKLLNADFQWSTIVPHKEYKLSACSLLQRKLAIYIQEYKFSNSRFSWKNLFEPLVRVDKSISLFDYTIKHYKMPFIKKSLLKDHWINQQEMKRLLEDHTNFPSYLIDEVLCKK